MNTLKNLQDELTSRGVKSSLSALSLFVGQWGVYSRTPGFLTIRNGYDKDLSFGLGRDDQDVSVLADAVMDAVSNGHLW